MDSANWWNALFSADCIKSSVLISSTLRKAPLASSMKAPFVKLLVELLLFVLTTAAVIGDFRFATSLSDGAGRVRILCLREPSLPLGTLNPLTDSGAAGEVLTLPFKYVPFMLLMSFELLEG